MLKVVEKRKWFTRQTRSKRSDSVLLQTQLNKYLKSSHSMKVCHT